VSDFGLTNAGTIHAANSLLGTLGTFLWQISHIRQSAQEEGWFAAEVGQSSLLVAWWSMEKKIALKVLKNNPA
jgi:hypothetical protein